MAGLKSYKWLTYQTPAVQSSEVFNHSTITDQIGFHSVLLPLFIAWQWTHSVESIKESYVSTIMIAQLTILKKTHDTFLFSLTSQTFINQHLCKEQTRCLTGQNKVYYLLDFKWAWFLNAKLHRFSQVFTSFSLLCCRCSLFKYEVGCH